MLPASPVVETIRPEGFNEPPYFWGFAADNVGETEKIKLYRRSDGREHYLVDRRTGKAQTISRAAATIIGLWIDRSITVGELRLLARIFGVQLGKGVLA